MIGNILNKKTQKHQAFGSLDLCIRLKPKKQKNLKECLIYICFEYLQYQKLAAGQLNKPKDSIDPDFEVNCQEEKSSETEGNQEEIPDSDFDNQKQLNFALACLKIDW